MSASFAIPSPESVGQLRRAAAKWTVACMAGRQVLAIGSAAVLARLVSPHDYGLLAMVTSLTGLVLLVSDLGLTWGIVQARELDQARLDTLFWMTSALGLMAWLGCAAAGPWLAQFYQAKELAAITAVMGAYPFFNNLSIVPMALLRRAIRQKTISKIQLLTFALASGAAVLAAWLGAGWWALVVQQLLACMAAFAAAWWCSGFRPGRPGSLSAVAPLLKFGGFTGLSNVVNYFQASIGTIAVGYFCGPASAGYFSRALLLSNLPTQYGTASFHDVMIPSLVALRDDSARMAAAYRKSLAAIAFVGCPLSAWLGVAAPEVIHLLYGPRWADAGSLLSWLAVAGVVLPVQATAIWLYLATGKSRRLLWQAVAMTALVVAASLTGAHWGALGIAAAASITIALPVTWATLFLAHRAAGICFRDSIRTLAPILVGCGLAVVAGLAAGAACHHADLPCGLILAGKSLSGGVAYLAAVYSLNGGFPVGLPMPQLSLRTKRAC